MKDCGLNVLLCTSLVLWLNIVSIAESYIYIRTSDFHFKNGKIPDLNPVSCKTCENNIPLEHLPTGLIQKLPAQILKNNNNALLNLLKIYIRSSKKYIDQRKFHQLKYNKFKRYPRSTTSRQLESLNPLNKSKIKERPSDMERIPNLPFTPLASKHHPNYTYTEFNPNKFASFSNSRPANGHILPKNPVDPSLLLLNIPSSRPSVPSRPPSQAITKPNTINPASLLIVKRNHTNERNDEYAFNSYSNLPISLNSNKSALENSTVLPSINQSLNDSEILSKTIPSINIIIGGNPFLLNSLVDQTQENKNRMEDPIQENNSQNQRPTTLKKTKKQEQAAIEVVAQEPAKTSMDHSNRPILVPPSLMPSLNVNQSPPDLGIDEVTHKNILNLLLGFHKQLSSTGSEQPIVPQQTFINQGFLNRSSDLISNGNFHIPEVSVLPLKEPAKPILPSSHIQLSENVENPKTPNQDIPIHHHSAEQTHVPLNQLLNILSLIPPITQSTLVGPQLQNTHTPTQPQSIYPYTLPTFPNPPATQPKAPTVSASVAVDADQASASSKAEGAQDSLLTTSTVIKGTSTSNNNNFYSNADAQNAQVPLGQNSELHDGSTNRFRPLVIIDGKRNNSIRLSDIFPDSTISIGCSRARGCPTFIVRNKPESLPTTERPPFSNIYEYTEGEDDYPKGNININCNKHAGCPTYIINRLKPDSGRDSSSGQIKENQIDSTQVASKHSLSSVLIYPNKKHNFPIQTYPNKTSPLPHDSLLNLENLLANDSVLEHDNSKRDVPSLDEVLYAITVISDSLNNSYNAFQEAIPSSDSHPIIYSNGSPENQMPDYKFPSKVHKKLVSSLPQNTQTNTIRNHQMTHNQLPSKHSSPHVNLQTSLMESLNGFTSNPLRVKNLLEHSYPKRPERHEESLPSTSSLLQILDLDSSSGGSSSFSVPDTPSTPSATTPAEADTDPSSNNRMRYALAAMVFGLPVTTALMSAFGAPLALMAPLGLAIPALLTFGFTNVNSNSGGFGNLFRMAMKRRNGRTFRPKAYSRQHLKLKSKMKGSASNFEELFLNLISELEHQRRISKRDLTAVNKKSIGSGEVETKSSEHRKRVASTLRKKALLPNEIKKLKTLQNEYKEYLTGSKIGSPSTKDLLKDRKFLLHIMDQVMSPKSSAGGSSSGPKIDLHRPGASLNVDDSIETGDQTTKNSQNFSFVPSSTANDKTSEYEKLGVQNKEDSFSGDKDSMRNSNKGPTIFPRDKTLDQGTNSSQPVLLKKIGLISGIGNKEGSSQLREAIPKPMSNLPLLPVGVAKYPKMDLNKNFMEFSSNDAAGSRKEDPHPTYFVKNGQPNVGSENEDWFNLEDQTLSTIGGFKGSLPNSLLEVILRQNVDQPVFSDSLQNQGSQNDSPRNTLFGDPSFFSDYNMLASALTALDEATVAPDIIRVDPHNLEELDPSPIIDPVSTSSSIFDTPMNIPPEILANLLLRVQFPPDLNLAENTRLTPELTDALSTFIQDLADAIINFLQSLQALLADNPLLAVLLGFLLTALLYHIIKNHGKKGHGHSHKPSGYHRRYWSPHYRMMRMGGEDFTHDILTSISSFKDSVEKIKR